MTEKKKSVSFAFSKKSFNADKASEAQLQVAFSALATLKASETKSLLSLTRTMLEEALASNGAKGGYIISALLSSKEYAVRSYKAKLTKMLRIAGIEFDEENENTPKSFKYPKDCATLDDVIQYVESVLANEAVNYKEEKTSKTQQAKVNIKTKKGRVEFYELVNPLYKKAVKSNNAKLADLLNFIACNINAIDDLRTAMKKDHTAIDSKDQIK